MRLLFLLFILAACANTLTDEVKPPPAQERPLREPDPPVHKRKPEKPEKPPVIVVSPPPKPICIPLAIDERKRIIQALDCILENEKAAKP